MERLSTLNKEKLSIAFSIFNEKGNAKNMGDSNSAYYFPRSLFKIMFDAWNERIETMQVQSQERLTRIKRVSLFKTILILVLVAIMLLLCSKDIYGHQEKIESILRRSLDEYIKDYQHLEQELRSLRIDNRILTIVNIELSDECEDFVFTLFRLLMLAYSKLDEIEEEKNRKPDYSQTHILQSNFTVKAEEEWVIATIKQAFDTHTKDGDRAIYVREKWEQQYGGRWGWVVGNDYFTGVWYYNKHLLFYKIGDKKVTVFESP